MEKRAVIDTGFISSFFKINRINLIFDTLKIDELIIPTTVLNELKNSNFYQVFLEFISKENRIKLVNIEIQKPNKYGKGELSCIAIAKKINIPILTDDKKAGEFAKSKNIVVIDIPAFLLHSKNKGVISKQEVKQIIEDLKEKDYYEFSQEVLEMLE